MHNPTKRVLDILLSLRNNPEGLTFTEITNITNIPKSTLSPILRTMIDMDFIQVNNELTYTIGLNSFIVGEAFKNSVSYVEVIKVYMKQIVRDCNEVCQLGIYTDEGVLYIEKIEPEQSIKLVSKVGSVYPLYATALGKSLLTQFNDDFIRKKFNNNLIKYTDLTVNNIDQLIEDVNFARVNKYSKEIGELSSDIHCVAVPIELNGKVIAAISVSIPYFRSNDDKLSKIANLLLEYKYIIESDIVRLDY